MTTPVNATDLTELDSPTHFVVGRTSDGKYGKVTFADPASVADNADRAEAAAAALAGVQAYGATGDGVTDDTDAFTDALADTTGAVYVPPGTYSLTALSEADRKRLWGPGIVVVASVLTTISSAPLVSDAASFRYRNDDWQPEQWPGVTGSLHNGVWSSIVKRAGGYGTYGAMLSILNDEDDLVASEFSSAFTTWSRSTNLAGGTIYAGWMGANSPASALGQTFSSGYVVGLEVNTGNRWGDSGLMSDTATSRAIVGLKVIPDVLPASDGTGYLTIEDFTIASPGVVTITGHGLSNGAALKFQAGSGTLPTGITAGTVYYVVSAATDTFSVASAVGGTAINTTGSFAAGCTILPSYPSSFGISVGRSNHMHRWWTGVFIRQDAVMPAGYGMHMAGGSSANAAWTNGLRLTGNYTAGINMAQATISSQAILLGSGAGHKISWGGGYVYGTATTLILNAGAGTSEGRLSANGDVNVALRFGSDTVEPLLGLYNTTPIGKQTVAASATDLASVITLANSIRTLGINLGAWKA